MWKVRAVEVDAIATTGTVTAQNRRSTTAWARVRSASVPMAAGGAPSGDGSAIPPSMTRPEVSGLTR